MYNLNLSQYKTEYEKIMYISWKYWITYDQAKEIYNYLRGDLNE